MADDTLLEYGGAGRPGPSRSTSRLVCAVCGTTLSGDARFCPFDGERLLEAPASSQKDQLLGTVVDHRYQVLEVLGEGGMGTVYRVRHTSLDREFALKALRRDLAQDADLSARFVHEARAAAAISHPSVVRITDYGELSSGQPYFVMELLTGQLLSQLIRDSGPLEPERTMAILRQVAEGLEAAHQAGIVHRDLKPDNIHIGRSLAGSDLVTVLDFGLAKVAGTSKLTREGIVFGTPHYMSPEQAAGEPATSQTDIYALGIVAYQMLTGRLPFEADSFMEVLSQHLYVAPVRPSELIRALAPLGGLEEVVLRCLEKRPDQRYGSMAEVLADLARAAPANQPGAISISPSEGRPAHAVASPLDRESLSSLGPERGGALRRSLWVALAIVAVGATASALYLAGRKAPDSRPDPSAFVPVLAPSAPVAPPSRALELPVQACPRAGPAAAPSQPKANLAPKAHKPAREAGTPRRKVQSVGEIVNPWER